MTLLVPFARLGAVVVAGIVVVLSLLPIDRAMGSGYSDKLDHFAAYAALGALATLGWGARSGIWPLVAACMALGGALELLQNFSPGRVASFADMAANASGALAGAAGGWALLRWRQPDVR
ncbi:VanZ family protein [Arenibaculum sp.]|uniref:VanZ family protein n=1 Tax=Arenibaculum sp. TaxID=2865862 RepID=UPI002E162932|nr:VanZ family protein [Arenibaculum sp.]